MTGISAEIPARERNRAGDRSGDAAAAVHRVPPAAGGLPDRSTDRVGGYRAVHRSLPGHRDCLIRAVRSCTRLKASRSTVRSFEILSLAWITVEWSRPPNLAPILGSETSVSSRARYIATWRGKTMS